MRRAASGRGWLGGSKPSWVTIRAAQSGRAWNAERVFVTHATAEARLGIHQSSEAPELLPPGWPSTTPELVSLQCGPRHQYWPKAFEGTGTAGRLISSTDSAERTRVPVVLRPPDRKTWAKR